jgi:DNA processing protein
LGVVRTAAVSSSAAALPEEAYAAALASVPSLGPKGLRAILDGSPPHDAWTDIRSGGEGRRARWACEARRIDVAVVWREHARRGITVAVRGGPGYPVALAGDVEAPAVLFAIGDPLVLDRHPRVAIVGTRSATRYGLGVAADLGAELAAHGVVVVSGLALGIDGAAHEGALAPPRAAPARRTVRRGPGARRRPDARRRLSSRAWTLRSRQG